MEKSQVISRVFVPCQISDVLAICLSLQIEEFCIFASQVHQFLVEAAFDDVALFYDEDAVS